MPLYLRRPDRSASLSSALEPVVDYQPYQTKSLPDIDEDPFAHFISPISDEDDPWELSLTAGILLSDSQQGSKSSKFKSGLADKWARCVKYHGHQLASQYQTAELYEEEEESFMGLDDHRLHESLSILAQVAVPASRSRAQELVARKAQNRRRQSRTLSGHRHSWREPSPELWTVDESEEEETLTVRRPKARKASRSRVRCSMAEWPRL